MGSERWEAVRGLLDAALDLPREQRAEYLTRACAGDLALLAEVESLLAFEDGAVLEPPSVTQLERAAGVALGGEGGAGATLGRFRLEELIAIGGMGEVWRARRTEGFEQLAGLEQTVAVKLIRRGVDTVEMLRRFANERALLAGLQHDGIARLFDGGVDGNGRPFMVMEFVDGVPIDDYCREHDLPVRERLELFALVCDAVDFAHEHHVIHRDIKPSNILVTREGKPKLLDFGIAKVLMNEGESAGTQTATGQRVMTPAYASPEQLRGEVVTARSDVYSLGLVMWELLVLAPAFDGEREPDSEVVRASVALRERTGSRRLARDLTGDLDTILATACHSEPARRYGGAAELAADLRRHLAFQPIRARRDSVRYRVGKFVRRNRVLVAATSTVFLALAAASIVSTNMYLNATVANAHEAEQRTLAKQRFDQTRSLATGFMFEVHDQIQDVAGTSRVRTQILTTVARTLDSLAAGHSDDQRELDLELFEAYERLAGALEAQAAPAAGSGVDAHSVLDHAQVVVDRCADDPALHAQLSARLAYSRGDVWFNVPQNDAAAERFQACLYWLERVPERTAWSNNSRGAMQCAAAIRLAQIARKEGQRDEAACWLDEAGWRSSRVELGPRLFGHHQAVFESEWAELCVADKDARRALEHALLAVRWLELDRAAAPESVAVRLDLARGLWIVEHASRATGDEHTADDAQLRAVDLLRELAFADPFDSRVQDSLSDGLLGLGNAAMGKRQYRDASALLDELAGLSQQVLLQRPGESTAMLQLVRARAMQTSAEVRVGTVERAVDLARETAGLLDTYLPRIVGGDRLPAISGRIDLAAQLGLQFANRIGKLDEPPAGLRDEMVAIALAQIAAARAELTALTPREAEKALHQKLLGHCTELPPRIEALSAAAAGR